MAEKKLTGYPSVDQPWLKYYKQVAIEAPVPECSLYEYLRTSNEGHIQETALLYFGRKITFESLFLEIERVAKSLSSIGVKENEVCTIISLSCVNSVVLFYAINRIGAISNFVNVLASPEEMRDYIAESKSNHVFCLDLFSENVLPACGAETKLISFSLSDYMPVHIKLAFNLKMKAAKFNLPNDDRIIPWRNFLALGAKINDLPKLNRSADSIGAWAHTGGTTGFPKTVLHTDRAYNAVAMQYKQCFEAERGQVFLNIIVPFVVFGMLSCMHMPLCLGVSVAIIPKFEAEQWKSYLKKYRPNHILGIPSYFIPMLSSKNLHDVDLSCVITIGAGGDGLTEELEQDINAFLSKHNSKAKLLRGYGMTEVGASAVTNSNGISKVGSVGIPLPKNNVRIYNNEKAQECKYGEIGEICLQSPSLMRGYKDNETATEELITIDSDGAKWVHTEDLGYVDEDGFLYIIGRMKRVMFVGPEGMAYKVFPQKIEEAIAKIPDVLEVCVVSTQTETGFAPIAYLTLRPDSLKTNDEVRDEVVKMCKQHLPDYMQPFAYKFLESLPKTDIGKVDYKAIEEMSN